MFCARAHKQIWQHIIKADFAGSSHIHSNGSLERSIACKDVYSTTRREYTCTSTSVGITVVSMLANSGSHASKHVMWFLLFGHTWPPHLWITSPHAIMRWHACCDRASERIGVIGSKGRVDKLSISACKKRVRKQELTKQRQGVRVLKSCSYKLHVNYYIEQLAHLLFMNICASDIIQWKRPLKMTPMHHKDLWISIKAEHVPTVVTHNKYAAFLLKSSLVGVASNMLETARPEWGLSVCHLPPTLTHQLQTPLA